MTKKAKGKAPTKKKASVTTTNDAPATPTKTKIGSGKLRSPYTPTKQKGVSVSRQKAPNQVHLELTRVNGLAIAICTKPAINGSLPAASFMYPVKKALEDEKTGQSVAESLQTMGMFNRRVANGANLSMKASQKNDKWNWEVLVVVLDLPEPEPEKLGKLIAKTMTKISKKYNKDNYDTFELASVGRTNLKSLSYHLLDMDCAAILAKLYAMYSKDELSNDAELMESFFGSAANGKDYLDSYDEDEWNELNDTEDVEDEEDDEDEDAEEEGGHEKNVVEE